MASAWGNRCSKACYNADENALLTFQPQWLAKLMDCYIHTWLNKWRMQGNFTKSKVMVFHPKKGESCSVPAQDRLNTWTTRRHRH
jgi:hypothetical protein